MREQALHMLDTGRLCKGWQYLLEHLAVEPTDRIVVRKCGEILTAHGRKKDLIKLYETFLEKLPEDVEMLGELASAKQMPEHPDVEPEVVATRRLALDARDPLAASPDTDEAHLKACMQWLRQAQIANHDAGVSALYKMDLQHWEVDYPETTGYIIPTFLAYGRFAGQDAYRNWAIEMGDWELEIQHSEGGTGEPVGVYGQMPRVFNTGQVLLGWLDLYEDGAGDKYLDGARLAADWILAKQEPDGRWERSTYAGAKSYQVRVAWALLQLSRVTGESKYCESAERAVRWTLSQATDSGWFDNTSVSKPGKPWTHMIAYLLVGLAKIERLEIGDVDRPRILTLLNAAAVAIDRVYRERKASAAGRFTTLPATFAANWVTDDEWSCLTGNAQVAYFLRMMANRAELPAFAETADALLADLKRLQFLEGVTDMRLLGGLPGAYPMGGDYCAYAIPDWAVKFFADGLLQRLSCKGRTYLG